MQPDKILIRITQLITALTLLVFVIPTKAATYTVTNTDDSGAGSLRQAILNANANPGYDIITFNIPGGATYQRINLLSLLPAITERVALLGRGQGGVNYEGVPLIELDGSSLADKTYGLSIAVSNCTVNGFSIGGFDSGIHITANNNFIYETPTSSE